MKTFKISKKTNEVISTMQLDYDEIVTSGADLCLVIQRDKALELSAGGKLHFEKFASGNTGQMLKVCEEDTTIKTIVDSGDTRYIYFEYVYIKPLTIASYKEIESPDGYKYKLYFETDHFMLPCDIEDIKLYVKRGGKIIVFSDLALCYPSELVKGEDIEGESNDCCDVESRLFNYETMERNSILAKTKDVVTENFTPEQGDQALFETNPYFHTEDDGTVVLYGGDDCPGEVVNVCKYTDFMGLGVVLEQDYDAKRMFQEYQVNELFVKKIKNTIIPDFIDLEKIKYAPAFIEKSEDEEEDDTLYLATGLTFNLHFRTRISGNTSEELPEELARYTFEDTWHFDDDTHTWNGMKGIDGDGVGREHLYDEEEFVNTSNLIGYLGFTDDDIYNQKNRVKKTFIRLSFYDDINPLTQNLLYYSTIFMDSGDLYGKYVKRKAWLEDNNEDYDQLYEPVVWSSGAPTDPCSAVTCQFIVNDEYDMTRSGEGFNLYLFRQDAPIEKEEQDIYMKVEFNHAGCGRTVPLIRWPREKDSNGVERENGKPDKLTMANYLENLYIPIKLMLTDRGYVYTFPNAKEERCNGIVWENERLVFNLFEPMIELESE